MNTLKQNRAASFIVVTLIYIFASAVGIAVYHMLTIDWWLNLLVADITATTITFAFSLILGNASVYNPYWSVQPIVILVTFAVGKELTVVRILLLTAVILWGVRLTANWAYTFKKLANMFLFLFVSIPLADGRQSSKPGYEEYKSQTRILLPFRK